MLQYLDTLLWVANVGLMSHVWGYLSDFLCSKSELRGRFFFLFFFLFFLPWNFWVKSRVKVSHDLSILQIHLFLNLILNPESVREHSQTSQKTRGYRSKFRLNFWEGSCQGMVIKNIPKTEHHVEHNLISYKKKKKHIGVGIAQLSLCHLDEVIHQSSISH